MMIHIEFSGNAHHRKIMTHLLIQCSNFHGRVFRRFGFIAPRKSPFPRFLIWWTQ
jgi:hypothetical protein